jgi:hypothetical protein
MRYKMRKTDKPGDLLKRERAKAMKPKRKARKHHLTSPLTGLKEGSPTDVAMDKQMADKMSPLHKRKHKGTTTKQLGPEGKHKMMKPKGARGRAQVKKLGRTKKTGGFAKIAKSAGKEYGSKEAGKRVAGAIFQKMVKARGKHKFSHKVMCKKKHKHGPSC